MLKDITSLLESRLKCFICSGMFGRLFCAFDRALTFDWPQVEEAKNFLFFFPTLDFSAFIAAICECVFAKSVLTL